MNHDDKRQFMVTIYPQEDDLAYATVEQVQDALEGYFDDVGVVTV